MVGETEENWTTCIEKTLEMAPESVTIYQMEVPYNTTIYKRMKDDRRSRSRPSPTGRPSAAGSRSAFAPSPRRGLPRWAVARTPPCRKGSTTQFLYRDALWHGADMLGPRGLVLLAPRRGALPERARLRPVRRARRGGRDPRSSRALALNDEERLIREFVLQMKLGRLDTFPTSRRSSASTCSSVSPDSSRPSPSRRVS